ncbi:MAG: restriction endonuclease subunit S [Mesorhizobium sp.]|uniref:restriction endonuclease subunit S n=1 Tax=Mesorhizobium sp. TaxID=1871066 RepID=UPI000FE42EF2|nr:restriction endonuclease subunit S [Mesorhizobium sp.]RWK21419.1 MAG: restriction endonuclease subunit S [Mesorhizobium sp.]RWK29505.1 MAG: restriction endonuclease subunit S [Mesorhizobium sp.]
MELVRVGSLGRVVTGRTPPSAQPQWFGSLYPFLTPSDMGDDARHVATSRFLSAAGSAALNRIMLPPNAICCVCIGATIGKVCMADQPTVTNQQINSIVVDPNRHDPHFVYYVLRTLGSELRQRAGGAATPIINKSQFEDIELELPDFETQRRMGQFLSAFDDLIENNKRRIAILEETSRRIYEEWFVHFRAPGCEGLPLVDSPLGPIPEGWTVTELMDFCQRVTDGAHKSPPTAQNGRMMASVKDMTDWEFEPSGCRIIDDADYLDLVRNDCKPLVGDILIAKDGANLNKHTFLVCEDLDIVLLSSIAMVRPKPETHKEFLVSALKSDAVSRRIKDSRTGAAIPRIILKDFKRLQLVTPPIALMQQFECSVHAIHSLCRTLSRTNRNLRTQRDLLLPKLISGEIDVSEAEEFMEAAE